MAPRAIEAPGRARPVSIARLVLTAPGARCRPEFVTDITMKIRNNAVILVLGALFTLTACKGAEAVDKLGEIKDKTCSCDGDQACLDEATKMAEAWVTEYKDAMGGDAKKAEEHMNGIIECAPMVAMGFAAAAE